MYLDNGQCEPREGPYSNLNAEISNNCALTAQGELERWGSELWTLLEELPGESGYAALDVFSNSACAQRSDGTLHCWGDIPNAPQIPFDSFDTGYVIACGVRADDAEIECWSDHERMQELISTIPSGPFAEVACAGSVACARTAAGAVTCWGEEQPKGLIADAPTEGVRQLDLADYHGVALMDDGSIVNWGGRSPWLDDGKD